MFSRSPNEVNFWPCSSLNRTHAITCMRNFAEYILDWHLRLLQAYLRIEWTLITLSKQHSYAQVYLCSRNTFFIELVMLWLGSLLYYFVHSHFIIWHIFICVYHYIISFLVSNNFQSKISRLFITLSLTGTARHFTHTQVVMLWLGKLILVFCTHFIISHIVLHNII